MPALLMARIITQRSLVFTRCAKQAHDETLMMAALDRPQIQSLDNVYGRHGPDAMIWELRQMIPFWGGTGSCERVYLDFAHHITAMHNDDVRSRISSENAVNGSGTRLESRFRMPALLRGEISKP